jgi:LuxR family maltose regulon positive regulatory protein
MLTAPAGFGKTNLLIEWAGKTKLPIAWLTLDSGDNDPVRLFQYVIGALRTLEPGLGEDTLDFLRSVLDNDAAIKSDGETLRSWREFGLTLLLNDIAALQKEIVLVLDDFHALDEGFISSHASYFLRNLPPNMHLVISSRSEPAIDLAFLRSKRRVVELGVDDIRFTGEEIGQFFQLVMGLHLSPETIQKIEQRTEGWVTALHMASLSLYNQPDPDSLLAGLDGDSRHLVDFLAEEVLERQPEEIRQFLLRSSILDTLSGPLCEAVVNPEAQPGYGTVMLDRLEHARLFITALDERRELFRYHTLFSDFLRHIHLEINPAEVPVLQKRAAVWHEQNADLEEAFRYALASEDMEWCADLIQRNIQTMIKTGNILSLTHWVGKLPDEVIHRRPSLGLAYAWGLLASYEWDMARYWLDSVQTQVTEAEKAEQSGSERKNLFADESGLWNMKGGLAICQSTLTLMNGDMEQAAEYSQQAMKYLKEENPFVQSLFSLYDSLYFYFSGDTQATIGSLRQTIKIARQANNVLVLILATCELSDMLILQGQIDQAWATMQKVLYYTIGPDGKPLPFAGLVDTGLGEILLEQGSLMEARTYLERGYEAGQTTLSISGISGMVSMARLCQAEGNHAAAMEIISEASRLALTTESSQWDDSLISAVAIRMALQHDDLAEAEQWWIKGGLGDPSKPLALQIYPYHVYEHLAITQAWFLLRRGQDAARPGDLRTAGEMLDSLLREAERFRRDASRFQILALRALLQDALGDERAGDTLLQALALGEPQGYLQLYVDLGWRVADLLRRSQSAHRKESGSYLPSTAFIDRLLAALSNHEPARPGRSDPDGKQAYPPAAAPEAETPMLLSMREIEVLKLIAEGKSNQEISAELYLALNTVKRHAYNIFAKLEVNKRTQAVSKARRLGLIP